MSPSSGLSESRFEEDRQRLRAELEQLIEDMLMVEALPNTSNDVPTEEVKRWAQRVLASLGDE